MRNEAENTWKSQMELLHMKNIVFEMNSTAEKINRWFDIIEQERLVIFEEIVIETNQNETEKKKLKNQ